MSKTFVIGCVAAVELLVVVSWPGWPGVEVIEGEVTVGACITAGDWEVVVGARGEFSNGAVVVGGGVDVEVEVEAEACGFGGG